MTVCNFLIFKNDQAVKNDWNKYNTKLQQIFKLPSPHTHDCLCYQPGLVNDRFTILKCFFSFIKITPFQMILFDTKSIHFVMDFISNFINQLFLYLFPGKMTKTKYTNWFTRNGFERVINTYMYTIQRGKRVTRLNHAFMRCETSTQLDVISISNNWGGYVHFSFILLSSNSDQ